MLASISKTEKISPGNFIKFLNIDQLADKIHFLYTSLKQPEYVIRNCYDNLPKFEKESIDRYKIKTIKDRQILAKGLLYIALGYYLERDPQNIEIEFNEFGKPFLTGISNDKMIFFNMSHSNDLAVYAFAKDRNIGVDVEQIKQISDIEGVIDLCFSESEKVWFNKIPFDNKNEVFYKIWTSKEAYIKAIGMGLHFPPNKISTGLNSEGDIFFNEIEVDENPGRWGLHTFTISPDFSSAVVVENDDPEIEYYSVDNLITNR